MRRAVERRPAGDQVGLAGRAAQLPVAQRELDRRLDRLRAGGVEEAPGVGQRRDAAQLLGELQHRAVAEREAIRERELGDLPLHDLDEPRVAVPERHHHRAAAGVEVAAAVLVDDARAARAARPPRAASRATRSARSRHGGPCGRTVARRSPRGAHRCALPAAQFELSRYPVTPAVRLSLPFTPCLAGTLIVACALSLPRCSRSPWRCS